PRSSGTPNSDASVQARPPTRSRASSTMTSSPASFSTRAAPIPPAPAPITTASWAIRLQQPGPAHDHHEQQDDDADEHPEEQIAVLPAQLRQHFEVHAVDAAEEGERQENGADDGELVHGAVGAMAHHGHVEADG